MILKWILSGVRSALLLIWAMVLLSIVIGQDTLYAQNAKGTKPKPSSEDLYLRAPEVVPGTLAEMRDPAYWLTKMESPDKVVLTLEEIRERNKEYHQRMADPSGLDKNMSERFHKEIESRPGLLTSLPDFGLMSRPEISALTQVQIDKGLQYMRSRSFGNILGIEYSSQELDDMENEMSYMIDRTQSQSGITVMEAQLRIVPSIKPEYIGLSSTGKARWDLWNLDILPIATPVEVLHTSKSGSFLFVLSGRGYGWIPSENIAFGSKSEIKKFVNSENFIVCTGDKVPFYTDSTSTYGSGWFRMGDLLPRANISNSRLVNIPTRQGDGSFQVQEVWLAKDADVSQGYMDYSRKNVVVQAFKLIDNIYDWTGGWYGRNHATVLRDIFNTFGFELPGNGILLSYYPPQSETILPEVGKEAQFNAITSHLPFLTLQVSGSGHSQLYLGDYNEMPIVFDTHGYNYTDDAGNELEIKRFVVGTVLFPDYMLNQPITFIKLY